MARRAILFALLCALAACGCGGGGGSSSGSSDEQAQEAAGPGSAILSWTASPAPQVSGYRVYHGLASRTYQQPRGAGIAVGRVQRHVVRGLDGGTLYYFAVTACDDDGNESDYSNEASKLIE